MPGDVPSRVEARVAAFAAEVERFGAMRALPAPAVRSIDQHLNLTRSDLAAMDDEAVAIVAAEVSAYAYYLQDEVNKRQVVIDKCSLEIERLVGARVDDYGGKYTKREDRLLMAILDNDVARDLHAVRGNAQIYQARMAWLTARLSEFSGRLDSVRRAKDRYGKN